ncbi:MAG: HIT family protein [Gammaproteobacteria bacterium]|nr:HIT family protein [Gammaproteobacteria bacterium]MBU1645528.1 HIT family protein [Gammaproteobacteria bacterium]MBU1973670.1 HIT family protein [Gammaproteobacteria bacterium]
MLAAMSECALCSTPGGDVMWQDESCRVVLVGGDEGRDFPGFCRVVWHAHVAEMSDLTVAERRHLMNVVFATELALRATLQPDKINLASLGNVVPHLHWHVIPRWRGDSRFPSPIWNPAGRDGAVPPAPTFPELATAFTRALAELQAES